jgi:beta-phosphoglucomutase-like phosphatase (HAD superfamily)
MPRGAIFDVDGTLVDSLDLHARSWDDAFRHFGHAFGVNRIRDQIGKGGDQLMPIFLSDEELDQRGGKSSAIASSCSGNAISNR